MIFQKVLEFVESYELQVMRLVCSQFNNLINNNDKLYLSFLRSTFKPCPFYWIDRIHFSQRGHILFWIINDLKLIHKLEPHQLLHYPIIDSIFLSMQLIIHKEPYLSNLYNASLADPNLKKFTDYFVSLKSSTKKGGVSGLIWHLRFDLIFQNGVKQLDEYNERDLLERLAKVGTETDFEIWFPYFRDFSKYDFGVLDDLKNFQNEHYIYQDNVAFVRFLNQLNKMWCLSIYNILSHQNFRILEYLMDNFTTISESGIAVPICFKRLVQSLSFYKGKRGRDLYHWLNMKHLLLIDYDHKDVYVYPEFRNLELVKLILKDRQIDYRQYTFYFYLNSFKVYNFLKDNHHYSHQGGTFSRVTSIKLLINLLINGYKIQFNDVPTDGFHIEHLKNLEKNSAQSITQYFKLIRENCNESMSYSIIKKYIESIIKHTKNIYEQYIFNEDVVFKVCKCVHEAGFKMSPIFDYNVIHKLKDKHCFLVLFWIHKNKFYDFSKNVFSMFDDHGFRLFGKRYLPGYSIDQFGVTPVSK